METPTFSSTVSPLPDASVSSHLAAVPPHSSKSASYNHPPRHPLLQQLSPDQARSSSLSSSSDSSFLRLTIFLLSVGQLVLLAALLAALGFLFRGVSSSAHDASSTTPPPVGFNGAFSPGKGEPFVELSSLSSVPLEQLQNMHALVMKWPTLTEGKQETDNSREYLFHVVSAVREKDATTLNLSAESTLITDKTRAILLDSKGEEIGRVEFAPSPPPPQPRYLGRLMDKLTGGEGFGRYPRNSEVGNPETPFDAYCRYGCGKVALTFPYYYRPFQGYGYPLVGTQASFPQGYGGYPGMDMLAQQAGGVPAQQQRQQNSLQFGTPGMGGSGIP
eukprot:GHVS01085575.1.p1 GENE.GHVS01085575.1~~GHVS01085575.1.p1  ORF type:complete len:332 (-),score=75.17 GHVS01085575.1:494-1489(-)